MKIYTHQNISQVSFLISNVKLFLKSNKSGILSLLIVFSLLNKNNAQPIAESDNSLESSATVFNPKLNSHSNIKILDSNEFGSEKLQFDWLGIDGFVRVKKPKEKKWFKLRSFNGKLTEVKKHVSSYYPGYIYANHTVKDGKCTSIVLIDKEKQHNFSAKFDARPIPAMKLLNKLSLSNISHKEQVYSDLLALITDLNKKKLAIKYAPSKQTKFLASVNYVRCANDLNEVDKMASSLPADLENPRDVACICGLDFLNNDNIDLYTEEMKCDPTQAMHRLIERAPCFELPKLAKGVPAKYRILFLELAECNISDCINSAADYQFYISNYGENGKCISSAINNTVSALSKSKGLWNFIENNQPLIDRFRPALNSTIQNSVANEDHLVTYHKVFNDVEDLKWGVNWVFKNLPMNALSYLIEENIYTDIQSFIRHRVFLQSENKLEWAYFYLQHFNKDSFERKQVYLHSFALEENKEERNAHILDFLKENNEQDINLIEPYWKDCRLRLFISGSSEPLSIALHQDCIECVNDLNSFITYANIPTYIPHIDGFDRINRSLTSKDLRKLESKYPQLHERIGDVFVNKAKTVDDIDWYLITYLEKEYNRQEASEKGIELEAVLHGNGAALIKRIAKHQLNEEFSFDPSLVSEYVTCELMLPFLNLVKTANWVDDLFSTSCGCITPQNIEQYKPYFGHFPKFQEKVLEGIYQSLEIATANTKTIQIPELSFRETFVDSISLLNMDNPVLVLNVNGEVEKGVEYLVQYPDGNAKSLFTNGEKVVFLSKSVRSILLTVDNQKASKPFNTQPSSEEVTITVFDCPAAFYSHFKNTLINKTLRDNCLNSCEDIINNNGDWNDIKQILGTSLAKFAGKDMNVDSDLEILALETAQLYFNIAQPYYPKKTFHRVVKDISKALEKKVRVRFRS